MYRGVDLVYHGNAGQLEYDWNIAPRANPDRITLAFDGARSLHLDKQGNLLVDTAGGLLRQHRPLAYQIIGGRRRSVPVRFVLTADRARFVLGAYDHRRLLVIDPVLSYSSYLGGAGSDSGNAIATDASGNIYVAGNTGSTNYPTTSGAYQTTAPNGSAFVTKINAAGNAVVYSTYLGNGSSAAGHGIAVDTAGNAYIVGTTPQGFPIQGGFQPSTSIAGNSSTGFLARLNAAGSALLYSTYIGGSNYDAAIGVAVDAMNNAYVVGYTGSQDFPTKNAVRATFGGSGSVNGFLTKISTTATGSASLLYSTYLGGNAVDAANAVAVDNAGHAYVTGYTDSANFPTTSGAYQTTLSPGNNVFITKIDTVQSGNASLLYSTYLGGTGVNGGNGSNAGYGVAINSVGDAYVTGGISSGFPTTAGAFQSLYGGGNNDAFVTELNPTGTGLLYSTYLGGSDQDYGQSITVDSKGSMYVVGNTLSKDFPLLAPVQAYNYGVQTAFVTKLTANGQLAYSSYLGSSGSLDTAQGVAVDAGGNAYVTGIATSGNFPTTSGSGSFQPTYGGGNDAFVAKIAGQACPTRWVCEDIGSPSITGGQATGARELSCFRGVGATSMARSTISTT